MDNYFLKFILFFFTTVVLSHALVASCHCDQDCPMNMPQFGPFSSSITVSGATNDTLGQNGQRLIGVNINFNHDAVNELDVILVAPDGSSVKLMSNQSLEFWLDQDFNICFVACDLNAQPDPGFPAVINTWLMSQAGVGYNFFGSYFPAEGCLESLTGPVNGTWTLEMNDFVGVMGGTLFEWSLVFEDNGGTNCPELCEPPVPCLADAGNISDAEGVFCEGSPDLLLNPNIFNQNSPPDPAFYGYTFVIEDELGIILEYSETPDLTQYSPGAYTICGLSYLLEDLALIPLPNGAYSNTDMESDIDAGLFCADLTEECEEVIIESPLGPIVITGSAEACPNEPETYIIQNLDFSGNYTIDIDGEYTDLNIIEDSIYIITWEDDPGLRQICAEHENICGVESFCLEVEVLEPPEIEITGPFELCPGEVGVYEVFPPPSGGEFYEFVVFGGEIVDLGSSHVEVEWYSNNNFNVITVEVLGGACPHPEPETFEVFLIEYNLPQVFDYSPDLCVDDTGWAEIGSDPNVQSYFWYGNGITIDQGQGTSGPVLFSIDEPGISVLCVEMVASCGIEDPVCHEINVLDIPEPKIESIEPQCQFEFELTATLAPGNSGFWEQADGPDIAFIHNPQDPVTMVEVTEPGIYTFEFQEDNGYCTGSSVVEVEILSGLNIEAEIHQCVFDEYFVTVEISGGELPYVVNGEEIIGTTFESDLIPEGESYHFVLSDSSGCEAEVSGSHECPCQISPGSMSGDPIQICINSTDEFFGVYNNDGTPGPNDIGIYILHDSPGSSLGEIFAMNESGTFQLHPSMQAGETYYISFVIGPEDNGSIDLDAECLAVALGQAVQVFGIPTFSVPDRVESCLFTTEFTIVDAQPMGELSLMNNTDDAQVDWTEINPGEYEISSDGSTILTIEYVELNGPCTRSDTFEIEFFDLPEFAQPVVNCIGEEFYVSLEISGGTGPYHLNGEELPGSGFNSDTFPTGTLLEFHVLDEKGCYADSLAVTGDCQCIGNAGTIIGSEISLCTGDLLDPAELIISDTTLDLGDTLFFVLHDGSAQSLGEILAISTGEGIPFPMDAEAGEILFLNLIVAQSQNGLPDWADPCLHTSIGIPVIWEQGPVLTLDGELNACVGDLVELTVMTGGNTPFLIELVSSSGRQQSIEITEEIQTIEISVVAGEEIWEIVSVQSDCPSELSGQFLVNGREEVQLSLSELPPVCNNSVFGSEVNLNTLLSDDSIEGEWVDEEGEVISAIYNFDGFEAGIYIFTFSTVGFEGPCPGQLFETEITVLHCDCPEAIIIDSTGFCADENGLNLEDLINTQYDGFWEISAMDGPQPFPFIEDNHLFSGSDQGGKIELTFTLVDSFPSQCQQEFQTRVFIDYVRNAGTEIESNPFCEGEELILNLRDFLENEREGGNWLFEGANVLSSVEIGDLSPGELTFFYALESGDYCPGDTSSITLDIRNTPTFEVEVKDPNCFGDQNGEILITSLDEPGHSYLFSINNHLYNDPLIDNLSPGEYEVNLINSHGCAGEAVVVELVEPVELTVDLGEDIEGDYNEEINLSFTTNSALDEIENIHWLVNDQLMLMDEFELSFILQVGSEIIVEIQNTSGCLATDQIFVNLREQSVYLPNAFRPGSHIAANAAFGPFGTQTVEKIIEFRIHDRWGNQLFLVRDVAPDLELHFWDGTSNGENLDPGVYIFFLQYRDFRGVEFSLTGDFVLLR